MQLQTNVRPEAVNQLARVLAVAMVSTLGAMSSAHAAIDTSAATTGISDVSAAAATILAAMIGLSVAIWGLRKVAGFFGR